MQVDAASSEDLQAEAQDIKQQVAKDLGVDESAVTVEVTDDGRVAVSAPAAEGEGKDAAESKIAEAVRSELASSGVGGDVREVEEVVLQVDAASSEDLQAEVQDIKEQVAKDLGVDAAAVNVEVTDDGRVAVSAPVAEGQGKDAVDSTIANAVRSELASSGVGGDVQELHQPAPSADVAAPQDLFAVVQAGQTRLLRSRRQVPL